MSLIIALTGGIACGKTSVSNLFSKKHVPIIDADVTAKELVKKNSPALIHITAHFGDHILLDNGELNRSKLREIIFNDEHARNWLNNYLHPLIFSRMLDLLSKQTAPYVIWSVPLLIENNWQNKADRVLVVDAKIKTQLKRLKARDNINHDLALKILKKQSNRDERLKHADDVIYNDENDDVFLQVNKLHKQYLVTSNKKEL